MLQVDLWNVGSSSLNLRPPNLEFGNYSLSDRSLPSQVWL